MILVPLAVNKLVSGRNGAGTSTAAQSTVLDGNAPLSQLLTVSGRVGSGVAPSVELNGDASLSAPQLGTDRRRPDRAGARCLRGDACDPAGLTVLRSQREQHDG